MLNGIQLIRGVAATMVVMFHIGLLLKGKTGTDITPFTTIGAAGVDLFFIVSGFIVVYTTALRDFSARKFLYRRAVRVIPLYWLMTLLFGVLTVIIPPGLFSYRLGLTNFLTAFIFIPSYNFKGEIAPPLNQGWTLAYEMFFYVTLTIASLAVFRARIAVVFVFFAGLVAIGLALPFRNAALITYSDPILFEFVLGCIVADLLIHDHLRFGPRTASALIAVGAVTLMSGTFFASVPRFRVLFWGIPSFLIVLGIVRAEQFYRLGAWRTGSLIGDSSYSLYLSHTLVLTALGLVFKFGMAHWWGGLPVVPVLLVACILSGLLCWRYVERPLTDRLKRRQGTLSRSLVLTGGGASAPFTVPTVHQAD